MTDAKQPSFCAHCGVELEAGMDHCPLCGNAEEFLDHSPELSEYAVIEGDEQDRVVPVRRIFLSVWSVTMATALGIVLIVDVVISGAVGWSLIAGLSILTGYLIVVVPFFIRHWAIVFVVDTTVIAGLLFGIDMLDGPGQVWFGPVGLPILLLVAVLTTATGYALRYVRRLSGSALVLTASALLSVGIDVIVRGYLGTGPGIGWSAVVLISIVPLALFLFFIERTVARVIDFRRRFHI